MSFPVDAFPPAYLVDREDDFAFEQSDWAQSILQTRVPDPEVLTDVWNLSWRDAPGVVGQAIREHHRDHGNTAWDWKHPQEATTRKVVYLEPPQIAWTNYNRVSARVILAAAAIYA